MQSSLPVASTASFRQVQRQGFLDHIWVKQLSNGLAKSAAGIAVGAGSDDGEVTRVLPLAFLAPDIVEAILDGRQPITLTARYLKRLKPIPTSWSEQRRVLGFGAANPR